MKLIALFGLCCVACSSSGSSGPTPEPTGDSGSGVGVTRWYAVQKVQLGVTERMTGKWSSYAWSEYGENLDGRITTAEDSKNSVNTCKRRPGSSTSVLADSDLGVDNNFGAHVMAVWHSLDSDVETKANQAIADGRVTLLLRLDDVASESNDPSVPGAIYLTAPLPSPPRGDGTDAWPVDRKWVDSAGEPLVRFPRGVIIAGAWISGAPASVHTPLPIPGFAPEGLPLDSLSVRFALSSSTKLGSIAGAASASGLIDALTPAMRRGGICPGNATFDQIVQTTNQAADVVLGAPNLQDTSRECDGISVGLGFVAIDAVAPKPPADGGPTGLDKCL
jgi:hypothetical protein